MVLGVCSFQCGQAAVLLLGKRRCPNAALEKLDSLLQQLAQIDTDLHQKATDLLSSIKFSSISQHTGNILRDMKLYDTSAAAMPDN